MKPFLIVLLIFVASSAIARTQVPSQAQAEELKAIDELFNDPSNLALSGCEQSTWIATHEAIRADVGVQELPEASAEADFAKMHRIIQCHEIVSRNEIQAHRNLLNSVTKMGDEVNPGDKDIFRYSKDASLAGILVLDIMENSRANLRLLSKYSVLVAIKSFVAEAEQSYLNHAEQTRYRELAARYNALVNFINVKAALPINQRPVPLHCEWSTNPATHITQMDCQ